MNSREYWGLAQAYADIYSQELDEAEFKWDPNKNVIAAKGPKLGIMTKGDPKSWREPSEQEKGEIPLSSTRAFRGSPAGQKFIQQKTADFDRRYGVNNPPGDEFAAARKNTKTFTSSTPKPPRPTQIPTTTKTTPTTPTPRPKDTSITDMIGRSQIRQGAPINTGNKTSDIRSMALRGSVGSSTPAKTTPTPVNRATGSKKPGSVYSSFDMFDLVKGHLLDEGYADTEEAAIAIMANMSEEWRESILESGYFPTPESRRADEAKYGLRGQTVKPRTVQTQAASKMKPTLTK